MFHSKRSQRPEDMFDLYETAERLAKKDVEIFFPGILQRLLLGTPESVSPEESREMGAVPMEFRHIHKLHEYKSRRIAHHIEAMLDLGKLFWDERVGSG